jgi:hypothetical protein
MTNVAPFYTQPTATAASGTVTATYNPIPTLRWIGDDWQFEVAYLNQDGTPFDLSEFTAGASLFNHSDTPIDLTNELGVATVIAPPTDGLIYVVVYQTNTTTEAGITADPNAKSAGKTRLQVYIEDQTHLRTTILVQPIYVRQE